MSKPVCRFCGQRRLESGQFNCETERRPDGTWVRGWLCMYRTRREDDDFEKHCHELPALEYTKPEYPASTNQMELFA